MVLLKKRIEITIFQNYENVLEYKKYIYNICNWIIIAYDFSHKLTEFIFKKLDKKLKNTS